MTDATRLSMLEEAMQLHRAGDLHAAESLYRKLLTQNPGDPDALHLLGLLAHQAGHSDQAVLLIRAAISRMPTSFDYHTNLGLVLNKLGRIEESLAAYQSALKLRPDSALCRNEIGVALAGMGKNVDAIAAFESAIAADPTYAEAYNNLGVLRQYMSEIDAAEVAYRLAIQHQPNYSEAMSNLASLCEMRSRSDEAEQLLRAAIALQPNSPGSHNNLGNVLQRTDRLDAAEDEFRAALSLNPNYCEAMINLASCLKDSGQLDESLAQFDRVVAQFPTHKVAASARINTMHFMPAFSAADLQLELADWNERFAKTPANLPPHRNKPDPNKRLRIGYVSADLREHVVGWNLLPLLQQHDKAQFEIFAYDTGARKDAMTDKLAENCDHWRSLVGRTDEEAAQAIREDGIDLLVDLALHTSQNRLSIFALKPAPVQLTYLAYCGSTGMPAIDYRFSDPYMDPPGTDLSLYAERTVRLPRTFWCYNPTESPNVSSLPAQVNGFVTFGCLNNFAKVSPPALRLWMSILQDVPGSRLLMYAPAGRAVEKIRRQFAAAGIDSARLEFVGRQSRPDYFNTYNRIDIALDPFPYGGGITTCDALWMGVPVISLIGKTAVGRGGFSILSNLDLARLACDLPKKYRQTAIALANDLPVLTALRAELRDRMRSSPLMDAPRFARDVEAAYRRMWREYCRNKPV